MLFDGFIALTMNIIRGLAGLLPSLQWPSFLDLSGYDFDLSLFAYFVPMWLVADIIGFLITYTIAKWSIKLLEIIMKRRILP